MRNSNEPRPKTLRFQTTYLSDVGIRTLLTHALSLPARNPARATIKLLAERWQEGQPVDFGEPEGLADDAFDGLEDVMKEAA